MERPGIVDLRDLSHRYMWDERAIAPFIAAIGLHVAPQAAWRGFAPPRVLVLIAAHDDARLLERSRSWLAACEHLVIVRDSRGDRIVEDPELRPLVEEEWQAALATLPDHAVFDWRDESAPAPCRAAVEHAIARAAALPVATTPPVPANPDVELPMSAWLPWSGPGYRPHAAVVGPRLAMRSGRPVLVDARGDEIDLAMPRAPIEFDVGDHVPAPPLAAVERGVRHPGMRAYGLDPIHPIAWRGNRMAVYWSYVGARETGFLSATDHDWPCGPAKKLWGHADNDPVGVAVTPAADACAQTFEHDVLIITNVPVGWHRAGTVDVAAFVRDPRRVALYAQTAEFRERATDDLLEEDNREIAPVVVLGPSPALRYAVDLRHRVVRVRSTHERELAEIVGGPDEGFAVFDVDHRIVRRGTGILLGGWFRFATVEDGGSLWREDLATGARTLLGSAARVACVEPEVDAILLDAIREGRHDAVAELRANHATRAITGDLEVVAIPGTRNIIEIAPDFLRVV
jgi:hypothetical protein